MPPKTPAVPKVPGETPAPESTTTETPVMPPKTPAVPKVPGETPAPESTTTETVEETVSVSKSLLEQMASRLAVLEANPTPVARRANPDASLPDQDDVDVSKMKSPVLTKQGWLVPTGFGANPNGQKI